jgi:hypothetical protein
MVGIVTYVLDGLEGIGTISGQWPKVFSSTAIMSSLRIRGFKFNYISCSMILQVNRNTFDFIQ